MTRQAHPRSTSPATTQMGMILGTAAYMSPEQARGRPVDKRADIWAFGVVLFEMLTGRPLYQGESVSEVLAAVIKDTPDLGALPASDAASASHDPRALPRARSAQTAARHRRGAHPAGISDGARCRRDGLGSLAASDRRVVAACGRPALAGALAIGAGAAWVLKQPPAVDLPVRRLEIQTPDRLRVVEAAISPDGRAVAFSTVQKAWIRRLDRAEPIEIPGGGTRARVLLVARRQSARLSGPRPALESPRHRRHACRNWRRRSRLQCRGRRDVAARAIASSIPPAIAAYWRSAREGGETKRLLDPDPKTELDFHEPSALPDGKGVLFVPHRTPGR